MLALHLPASFKKFLQQIGAFFLFDVSMFASGIGCLTYGKYYQTLLLNLFLMIGILVAIAVVYMVETARARRSIGDQHSAQHEKILRELYDKFDPDGDGIGLEELRHIVDKIDPDTPDSAIEEIFEAADTDKGGMISYSEFASAVTGASVSENASLTDGLAAVVIQTQVMKLRADAIGRFFLVIFLCCKLLPDTCVVAIAKHIG